MSLYIPGVPLSHSFPVKITVWPDGSFSEVADDVLLSCGKVIEVQPHGRLGDLDAMLEFVDAGHLRHPHMLSWSDRDVESMIESRATIIPADRAKKDGET